jgi:hypothetical protein
MSRAPSVLRPFLAFLLLGALLAAAGRGRAAPRPAGELTVTCTSAADALGVEVRRRPEAPAPGLPGLGYESYFSLGAGPATKAGFTLKLDWEPLQGPFAGRRYLLNTSLSGRWPGGGGSLPEQAWEVDAGAKETGLGAASLEAGGRSGAYLNRLAGRDYREAAAYLATRFALDGEPSGLAWIEPDWLRGFASLLTPPPEPGSEERSDLPYWYEAAVFPGLPPLPPPEPTATAGEPRLSRLTVTTRHAQTWRTYAGDAANDWETGETRLEVREKRSWGEVAASYLHTVKFYPADAAKTYRLAEGELAVSGPAGPGRGRVELGFRQRFPWEGAAEAYRQVGLGLGYSLPGASVAWRFGGEWRERRYEAEPEDDYTRTTLEAEASWPAVQRAGGPAASATLATTEVRPLSGFEPSEYQLRLRLRGERPVGPGQTLSGGLAWERRFSAAPGDVLIPGATETLLRLAWKLAF